MSDPRDSGIHVASNDDEIEVVEEDIEEEDTPGIPAPPPPPPPPPQATSTNPTSIIPTMSTTASGTGTTTTPATGTMASTGQAPGAGAAQAIGINGVSGSQLNTIQTFSGKEDVEAWIAKLNRAASQFIWTDEQTSAAAKNKMIGEASQWLASVELIGQDYKAWAAHPDPKYNFSIALIDRFGETIAIAMATDAVMDLRQGPDETVGQFHDRVVRQVDRKNFCYTPAQKKAASYQVTFANDIYTFFGAGLREEIKQRVLSIPNAPTEHQSLLKAARLVEASERKAQNKKRAVLEMQQQMMFQDCEGSYGMHQEPGAQLMEVQNGRRIAQENQNAWTVEEMQALIEVMRKKTFQPAKPFNCYNCGGRGHYASACPSPPMPKNAGGQQKGNQPNAGRGKWNPRKQFNELQKDENLMTDEETDEHNG